MLIVTNPRHERFAQLLAEGHTADEAYNRAGYTPNRGNAIRLKANERIARRVAEIQAAAAERVGVTIERVLNELALIGFADMGDYMALGEDGTARLDWSKLPQGGTRVISEIIQEVVETRSDEAPPIRRTRFKLYDKRAALVDIGKHLGMFAERHQHTGKDGGPIEVQERTNMQRAREILALIAAVEHDNDS